MTTCPIQSIPSDADSVVISGRIFRINRLPSQTFKDELKRRENKAEQRLAERLMKKSETEQHELVRKKLLAERRQALIKREGLKGKRINLTQDQRVQIEPTEVEVSTELARLLAQNGVHWD